MRILITGIGGFAAGYLAQHLKRQKNTRIYGIFRSSIKNSYIKTTLSDSSLYQCDLTDSARLAVIIKKVSPERIFHLAGQASSSLSWLKPEETFESNVFGSLNLLRSLEKLPSKPKVHLAGSAEEYGKVFKAELPITETNALRPITPYAVSKISQSYLGYQYFNSFGIKVVRTRAFNHTGPWQSERFVASSFARQIALIEAGKEKPKLKVGNLNSVRDFTDVRDVVRAYALALEKGQPGEIYNISSGVGYKIKDILEILLNLSKIKIKVTADRDRFRAQDIPILVGDSKKFRKVTGWKPEIPLKETLSDLLNYWRNQISGC